MSLPLAPRPPLRRYHQAHWDEPIVFDLHGAGERGLLPSRTEPSVRAAVGDVLAMLPAGLRRATPPALPEIGQARVLRHYLRLSQENLGADLNVEIGPGPCTMKYSPKINERFARHPGLADLHPLQRPEDLQGVLEIVWRTERMLAEISGLDEVSLHAQGGSAAIWANIAMARAYHAHRGDAQRDEVVTTIFSHPSNAACAKAAGYRVITVHPGPDGLPDMEAYRRALSERTAAIMVTNPEDTGIYNPRIADWVDAAHQAGALAIYDQANANGVLGITRAREAGFDACQFNLHKTFSTPHGCGGPGAAANAVTRALAPFLPTPVVTETAGEFRLDYDRPLSIGPLGPAFGAIGHIVRAYAWIRALGADGLRAVAETAVLNNNYLMAQVLKIPGAAAPYAPGRPRIEQVRYSWDDLYRETGVTSEEIGVRLSDYGLHYWSSHHPWIVPQPFTLEPTESYSQADLDEYVTALAAVAREARQDPDQVRTAPHRQSAHRVHHDDFDDPARWAPTWRAYLRKYGPVVTPSPSTEPHEQGES
jgi:glycine dehydrogenase subunit 2